LTNTVADSRIDVVCGFIIPDELGAVSFSTISPSEILVTDTYRFSQKSAVGLPRHLLENSDKFKFLLPEGCMRETPGAAQELEALKADV